MRTQVTGPPADGSVPHLTFLAHPTQTRTQVGQLAHEMVDAWSRGHRLFAEAFLERHPELRDNRDAVLRLVCEEMALRQQAGMEFNRADLLRRFPQWATELQALLDCQDLIGDADLEPAPGLNPLLQEFDILAELGEGAQGQVYLAQQRSLANRPLVVKVSSCKGQEHVSLARLQHTNIVPLYWVKDDPEHDRRTMVMPFLGKVTLSSFLRSVIGRKVEERSGNDIVKLLESARETMGLDQPGTSPVRDYYQRKTYVESVCWIGSCLADALEYAHRRGLVHLDVKPSNVLLANDGQPMLLDFHLSCPPLIPGQERPKRMGGTPIYMSPEQHAGMAAVSNGHDLPLPIDGRSDIYSLGAILYQLLGGKVPLLPSPPRLDSITKGVSCGLADIVEKCVRFEAKDRYVSAAELGDDLRRHLSHLPLRGVPNRSVVERWRKYRKRRPYGAGLLAVAALSLIGAALALLWIANADAARKTERRARIATLIERGGDLLREKRADQAIESLQDSLELAASYAQTDLHERANELLRQAKIRQALDSLQDVSEQIRFAAGSLTAGSPALEKRCRELWQSREQALRTAEESAEKADGANARLNLLDLALLSVHLRVAAAPPSLRPEVAREALTTLTEAEQLLGAGSVLARERERIAKIAGMEVEAKSTSEPASAWEHFAIGRSYFLENRFEEADRHFKESLRLDPRPFWVNFWDGRCAFERNELASAVAAFQAALTVHPCAAAYYKRGRCWARLGETQRAAQDYDNALKHDESFAVAYHARGLLHLQGAEYGKAIRDFKAAIDKGHDPAESHYHIANAYLGLKDRSAALESVNEALRRRPDFAEAKALKAKLSSR